jgi:hypothetical protein
MEWLGLTAGQRVPLAASILFTFLSLHVLLFLPAISACHRVASGSPFREATYIYQ